MAEKKEQENIYKYLGLNNQGATCYMNSLLQTLYMTPEFRNALYKWKYNPKLHPKKEDCIPYQLQMLFGKLQLFKEVEYIDTKSLIKSFQWDPNDSFQQHDVQEFATVLFDAIEQSFKQSNYNNIIEDLYQSTSLRYVKCKKCLNESLREDTFLYLSLIVKNDIDKVYNPTVDKAIENYLKPCMLDGENKYYCENCAQKNDAEMGVKFATLPKIMTLSLNRFELDYETLTRRKLNNKVTFPFILNMNKFLKPFEEVVQLNALNQENQSISVRDPKFDKMEIDWLLYQQQLLDGTFRQGKIGSSATDDDLTKNKTKTKYDPILDTVAHSNLNENKSKDESSIKKPSEQLTLRETLAGLKNAKQELDLKFQNKNLNSNHKKAETNEFKIEDETLLETLANNENKYLASQNPPKKTAEELDQMTKDWIKNEINIRSLIENYQTEGEHLYELYSIMIHSGSAWGGHYYTYIKSFEDGQWYNFNDRSVSRISVTDIEQAFGEEIPKKNQGCSGYMLSYRKLDLDSEKPQILSPPEDILAEIESEKIAEKEKIAEEKRRKEEKEKEIILRVFYKGSDLNFVAKKTDKFSDLVEALKDYVSIIESPENFRIRSYSVFDNLMQETYTNREHMTLEELKFKPHKALIVEIKSPQEEWLEYDPSKITLKLNLWKPDLFELNEAALCPIRINIEERAKLIDLLKKIEEKFGITVSNQIIMKRNPYTGRTLIEIINKDENHYEKDLYYHRIFNGLNLYIEEGSCKEELKTKWEEEFNNEKHRVLVKFNDPAKAVENQAPDYAYEMYVDNRIKLTELKTRFADFFQIDPESFIMKKNGRLGNELKDLSMKLEEAHAVSQSSIYLQFGVPAKPGEYKLFFHFGALSAEQSDGINYDFEELFSLYVGNDEKVEELKKKIHEKLIEKNYTIDIGEMRLRERNSLYLGQILHDGHFMKEYTLFDRKSVIIERVPKGTTYDADNVMINIRFWDVDTFDLSDMQEIYVNKTKGTFDDLASIIKRNFSKDVDIECCRIGSLNSFRKTDLLSEPWIAMNENANKISTYPWYLIKDGALLIAKQKGKMPTLELIEKMKFQDRSKPIRGKLYHNCEHLDVKQKSSNYSIPMIKETGIKIQVKTHSAEDS